MWINKFKDRLEFATKEGFVSKELSLPIAVSFNFHIANGNFCFLF